MKPTEGVTAEIVVQHVRALIERGELKPGDRLPPERELAVQLGVSRPSVRAGLRSLAAIGVLQTRHGAGTVITDAPPPAGVARRRVRPGLLSLAAFGVLQPRHGAGTFITDGPPPLGSEQLSFLAAL